MKQNEVKMLKKSFDDTGAKIMAAQTQPLTTRAILRPRATTTGNIQGASCAKKPKSTYKFRVSDASS